MNQICLIIQINLIPKGETGFDTSKSAKKADLANLRSDIDKLNFGKLEPFPVNLNKLSNAAKKKVVKRPYIMNWIKEVDAIMTTNTIDLV